MCSSDLRNPKGLSTRATFLWQALIGLGLARHGQARYRPAADHFAQALEIARQTGDRNGQSEAHRGLGRVHHATGNYDDALHHQRIALRLAVELDQPTDQANAHDGLARIHRSLDRPDQARQHWQTALQLLASTGSDHTDEPDVTAAAIRAHLLELDRTTNGRPSGDRA